MRTRLTVAISLTLSVSLLMATILSHIVVHLSQGSTFEFSAPYTIEMLGRGLVPYLGSFVAQFSKNPLIGGLFIGLLYGGTFLFLSLCTKRPTPPALTFIPLLYTLFHYADALFLEYPIAMLLVGATFWCWSLVRGKKRQWIAATIALCFLWWGVGSITDKGTGIVLLLLLLGYGLTAYLWPKKWTVGRKGSLLWWSIGTIAFVWSGLSIYTKADRNLRDIMLIEQAAQNEAWDEVLRIGATNNVQNPLKSYLINVALFRTDRFNEELFHFPQSYGPEGLSFPWDQTGTVGRLKTADLVFANVGLIEQALRLAFESWEHGDNPALSLQKLAHYNTLLHQEQAAHKFKEKLDKTLHGYRPLTFRPKQFVTGCDSIETNSSHFASTLPYILRTNPQHIAAFDYMAAILLLSNNLSIFTSMIPRAIERHQGRLPKPYQEALAIWQVLAPEQFKALNYTLSQPILNRFNQFRQYAFGAQSPKLQELQQRFGDTYWFYLIHTSPYGSQTH